MKMRMCTKIITLIAVIIFVSVPFRVNAQIGAVSEIAGIVPTIIPFGGYFVYPTFCTCSGGVMLVISDLFSKSSLPILYMPGQSRINLYGNIVTSGVAMLGTYVPGAQCLITVSGSDCEPTSPQPIGTITNYPLSGFGTALYPPVD